MKQRQQLELADPAVDHWAVETGIVSHSLAIQLRCRSKATIELAIEQLQQLYGDGARIRAPHQDGRGGWVAFGSIGG